MLDVVSDMSKESSSRLQLLDVRERFIDPQVRWVFLEPQTVQHQHVQVSQRVDCSARDLAQICQVSKVVETIRHHRQTAMNDFERRYLQFAPETETRAGRNDIRNHFG